MSLIQTPWTSQPQQAVGIDWSNPITRGLVDVTCPNVSSDLISVNSASLQATSSGVGFKGDGVSSYWYKASASSGLVLSSSTDLTLFAVATGLPGTDRRLYAFGSTASNNPLLAIASGDTDASKLRCFTRSLNGANSGNLSSSSVAFENGKPHALALVIGTALDTYVDGVAQTSQGRAAWDTTTFNRTGAGALVRAAAGNYNAAALSIGLAWNRALSAQEIRSISQNPWQIFKPLPRRIFVPVAAGGNVTITGNIGDATAAGLTASVTQSSSPVTISAGVGNAVAAGSQASIAQQYTLYAGIGNATAAGLTATITASGLTTISCTTGNAVAAGSQAVVNSAATVTCSVGNASAAGLTVALDTVYTILANVGNATAYGLSATIQAATGISCGVANAIAAGLTASVTNNAALTDSEKIDLILDILSNRQTLDPVSGVYTLYADDGVTVLKTAQAWEDAAGTIPYRGRTLQRLDGMQ